MKSTTQKRDLNRGLLIAVCVLISVATFAGAGAAATDYGTVFLYQLGPNIQGSWTYGAYLLTPIPDSTNELYYFAADRFVEGMYKYRDDKVAIRYPYAIFTRSTNGAAHSVTNDGFSFYQDGVTTTTFSALAVNDVGIVGLRVTYPNGTTMEIPGTTFTTTTDLPCGTYKLSALFDKSRFAAGTPDEIFTIRNAFTFHIIDASEALIQPFISINSANNVIVKGTDNEIDGVAKAATKVQYYIFGTNYFRYGNADVSNSKYTIKLDASETRYLDAGQYFLVVQHPGTDRFFNIASYINSIYLNETDDAVINNAANGNLLINVNDRQKINAAQALCDAFESENIDDLYVKSSFIVAAPLSTINPIPYEIVKGSKLTVSGTTNVGEGKLVTVEMLSTAFAAVPKETVGPNAFAQLTTRTDKDGYWEVNFDTASLDVDEYTVIVAVEDLDAFTAKIQVIGGTPVQPTQPTEAIMGPGYSDLTVTPSTDLIPDQKVSAMFKITMPAGSIKDNDTLQFSSPLVNTKWDIKVFKGEANTNSQNPVVTITGSSTPKAPFKPSMFSILYDRDNVTLIVSFSGNVADTLNGQRISVFTAKCTSDEIGSLSPHPQLVYDTNGQSVVILSEGWNFISVPKYLDSSCNTIAKLLATANVDVNTITGGVSPLGYNVGNVPGWSTLSADTELTPLNGYWIHVTSPTTIRFSYPETTARTPPTKSLMAGWNAVGLCANEPMSARSVFSGLSWQRYIPWNIELAEFGRPVINGGSAEYSEENMLEFGNGGWLYVDTEGVYLGNTA